MRILAFTFCLLVLLASLSLVAYLQIMEVAQVITQPNEEETVYYPEGE
jgi:hypothetical protein